jgi:RNA polymerase sigma-70 factor (ECF subfamily)
MPDPRISKEGDAALVQEAKRGDEQSFGVLYERYAADIYRFLRAQLPDNLEAEDLTAEVFLKAWDAMGRFRERGFPFSAFLYKIARNTLIDHWRKQKRVLQESSLQPEGIEGFANGNISNPDPELETSSVQQVLRKLPEDYRMVLVYRFINQLTPAEIAAIMNRSEGAVRVLQHRALRAARKLLVEHSD